MLKFPATIWASGQEKSVLPRLAPADSGHAELWLAYRYSYLLRFDLKRNLRRKNLAYLLQWKDKGSYPGDLVT